MKQTKKAKKADEVLFRPLFRYVLAKKITGDTKKTKSGLILAGKHEDKLSHTNKAIIVAIGSRAFEYEPLSMRPKIGDIVHFTRYEDFIIDHTTKLLEGEHCMIYDEYVTAVEL